MQTATVYTCSQVLLSLIGHYVDILVIYVVVRLPPKFGKQLVEKS